MGARAQAILPLALVVGVLSFLWTEFSLNFTFHWYTVTDNVFGAGSVGLPHPFHLILPTAFISWGLFFCAGGDNAAFGKIVIASVFGTIAALITMYLAFKTADMPHFWGIALWVGIFAFILVAILIAGDWYYVAGTFPAFASVFLWWIATGLDGWSTKGSSGGWTHSANAVVATATGQTTGGAAPATAGGGAFWGLISTTFSWVWFDTLVTLLCGCVLGIVSAKVAALITPKPKGAEA